MPFIPVEDTAHIRIEGRADGQQSINDLYFRHSTGPIAAADMVGLVTAIRTWYTDTMAPLLNENWVATAVHGRDLTAPIAAVADLGFTSVQGGVTGEAAPNNCSMAVSFRSGLAGRAYRGRNYVPMLTNSEVSGNYIDPAFATGIVDGYSELLFGGGALPAGWVWVIVSRFLNNEPRVAGIFTEVFSVLVTDLVVDSQRRRLPGRGN